MNEKRICIRLNMDKYSHRMVYEIYLSIPSSQRSDFIRLAIILMNDRDEQLNRIREMLSVNDIHIESEKTKPKIGAATDEGLDISDDMLDFITSLQTQK